MKMTHLLLTTLTFFLMNFGAAHHAAAAPPEYRFDTAHSNFYFDVQHIFSTIRGYFSEYSGTVKFDPANLKESAMRFEVKVDSIQTAIAKRDTHLRSDDFFSAGKFPRMTFESTEIRPAGENRFDVAGKLTIKDVTKEVVLPFTYFPEKDHPADPKSRVAGFEARLTLDRHEYRVGDEKYFKMGLIGKDVTLLVSLEVMRDK